MPTSGTSSKYQAENKAHLNGHTPSVEDIKAAARAYDREGWSVITFPYGQKGPAGQRDWQHKALRPEAIERLRDATNIGILTGVHSHGLHDVDLDTPQSVTIGATYALPTQRIHGRASKPRSHYWYVSTDEPEEGRIVWGYTEKRIQATDNKQTTYVELRGSTGGGIQTMVPPSIHPEGELVRWDEDGEPGAYTYAELKDMCLRIAVTTILARHWPSQGNRDHLSMAIAGGLVRAGWTDDEIDACTRLAARLGHDEEWQDRAKAAATRAKIDADDPATGWPHAMELLEDGEDVVKRIWQWLDIQESGLPRIPVSGRALRDIEAQSRHALEARQVTLPDHDKLYTQDGRLVWVRESHDATGVTIKLEDVRSQSLAVELSRAADFVGQGRGRPGKGKVKAIHTMPPAQVTQALVHSREWTLPNLRLVTSTPILHADGSLVTTPGYDPLTQAIYWPTTPLTLPAVPERPTRRQAQEALEALQEPFVNFPFADDASRANNLALLFTVVLRQAIPSFVPAAAIDAPDMGYGKTLLAQTHLRIGTGGDGFVAAVPTNEEEWGKQIATWLSEGRQSILLDNIEVAVQSPALEQVLTASRFSRRVMGTQRSGDYTNDAVWILTGNNLVLRGSLPRRVYIIRMGGEDQPWARNEFKHKDLGAWVRQERPRLLAAVYTIYRYWLTRGSPQASHGRELASYDEWARVVGGVLDCVGVSAFLEGANDLMEESDPSRGEWAEFIQALHAAYPDKPFRASEVFRLHINMMDFAGSVAEALPSDLQPYINSAGTFSKRLGAALNARRGQVVGGVKILRVQLDKSNGSRYKLVAA